MKTILTISLFFVISLLSACSTVTEEAGFKEVSEFYGGSVSFKKGAGISTTATELQGSYLEVDLHTPGIGKYYSNLQVPASNCAYLVYKHLRPKQRSDYDYFKVVIQDSAASHTYTFSPTDLELATTSIGRLNALMFSLQADDTTAIVSKIAPPALGTTSRDSVMANLRRISRRLEPFDDYLVQGFDVRKMPLAGQVVPIVRFALSVSRVQKSTVPLLVFLNPTSHAQQFLCGLRIP
jgi:hypothetical protein